MVEWNFGTEKDRNLKKTEIMVFSTFQVRVRRQRLC